MRRSVAALAVITTRSESGEIRYLTQWNQGWNGLSLIGGHRRDGESFRDCVVREATEELRVPATEFDVPNDPVAHLEYVAYSESAEKETRYEIELFPLAFRSPELEAEVASRGENRWVSPREIESGETPDGQPIGPTVALLLRKTARMPAPRDSTVFTVGVTGHRDLVGEDRDTTLHRLRRVFDDFEKLSAGRPVVVLSPLAEGADQLVAEVALEHRYRLIAPLPLPVEEYRRDFEGLPRERFEQLLSAAREWFSLPMETAVTPERRPELYAAVGRYVVDQCDALIGLWDGRCTGRTGGTDDTLAYAFRVARTTGPLRLNLLNVRREST